MKLFFRIVSVIDLSIGSVYIWGGRYDWGIALVILGVLLWGVPKYMDKLVEREMLELIKLRERD